MDLRNLLIFIFFITMPLAQNITLQTAAGSTPIAVDGVILT
jgi:Na+/glutamate symporter